jgi:pilus assembly protein CpaF
MAHEEEMGSMDGAENSGPVDEESSLNGLPDPDVGRLFAGADKQGLHARIRSATDGTGQPGVPRPGIAAEARRAERRADDTRVDHYADLKTSIHHACITKLGPELFRRDIPYAELSNRVLRVVSEELARDRTPLTRQERSKLVREIADDVLGYGPLEPLLADETVTEIMVNGFDQVYIERAGKIQRSNIVFVDDAHLTRIIDKIVSMVGRRVDESSPMVDARLPDGSRVNAIVPPLALDGPTLTIRKFAHEALTIEDLITMGTITEKASEFMAAAVRGKLNILIAGGSGVGKTTLLNNITTYIPSDERIITIEDAAELQLQQSHIVRLESRPPNIEGEGEIKIRQLVRNALRMRPDRIIVGEVRGAETLDMLQAMNTGHEGSLTTIHANSPRDALHRLETLVLTAGVELPLRAIREQIASAFDLMVHLSRLVDGSRRVTHITEVLGMEGEVITLQDVFVAKPPGEGTPQTKIHTLLSPLRCTGLKPHFLDKLAANDVILPARFFDHDEEEHEPNVRSSWMAGTRVIPAP